MRPPIPPLSAVLLAAGRSTRMGRDKALLEVEHRDAPAGGSMPLWPLWRRQRDVLTRAGAAEIFLSAREGQTWANAAAARGDFSALVRDTVPVGYADAGPLAGIAAALACAAHPHLAVLAIDLPRMEPEWLAALHAECAPGIGCVGRRRSRPRAASDAGAAAGDDGNYFEPLAAIFPRALLPLVEAALARGDFSLQRLIAAAVAQGAMRVREIGADETAWFENWNEPRAQGGSVS